MMVQMLEKLSPPFTQHKRPVEHLQEATNTAVIQVIIVDAHLLIREALQRVISSFPQVHICASLNRTQEALGVLQKKGGDVLVLGSSMTASDCLESVKAIHEIPPSPGIVVIQQQLCPETVVPLLRSGVQSLLGEDSSEKDLARAISAAATGNTFLGQRTREILDGFVSRVPLHFTEREMQVLPLLRSGSSNSRIAQQLGLKEKTVEKHLTHIYEKLHIQSRTEAILRIQTLHI